MARVLLYNFADEERRRAVKALLFRFSVPCREVPAESPFADEMLVMHGLSKRQFNGLLDGLRQAGVQVLLKAVVTPHNVGWSANQLYAEILAEHEAMRAAAEGKN